MVRCFPFKFPFFSSSSSFSMVPTEYYFKKMVIEDYDDFENLTYEGEVNVIRKNMYYHGTGTSYYSESGNIEYYGEWNMGKKCGHGVFHIEEKKFEDGILEYDHKIIYEGGWFLDKYHGNGIYYKNGKKKISTTFNKGIPSGIGIVYDDETGEIIHKGEIKFDKNTKSLINPDNNEIIAKDIYFN